MGLLDKLSAKTRGEISTDALVAYSTANADAYSLIDEVPETGIARLSAWCAFAIRTHADNLLASGSCIGFASAEACSEAQLLFEFGSTWLDRARQAAANPGYVLDCVVPQRFPNPRATRTTGVLRAMKKTLETAQSRVGADLVDRAADPAHDRLAPMMAAVQSALDSAGALGAPSVSDEVRFALAQSLQDGIDRAYQIGQLLALPELLGKPKPVAPVVSVHDSSTMQLFLPGDVGFDPWCLTDPIERRERRSVARSIANLDQLWKSDPEPEKTLAIQAEIAAALERGGADFMPSSGGTLARLGSECPWPGVLYAKTQLSIAGKTLAPGDCFVFTVGASDSGFVRAVVSISAASRNAAWPADLEPTTGGVRRSFLSLLAGTTAAATGLDFTRL